MRFASPASFLLAACSLLSAQLLPAQNKQPGKLTAPASQQQPSDGLEFRAKAAFAEWVASQPGQWVAQWNPATLTPHTIYGTGLDIQGWTSNTLAAARVHAIAALAEHRAMLGLGSSEYREIIGARMGRSWSFSFAQHFRGLPVVGGRADVRINMVGRIAMLGSVAVPVPADFDTTPLLGAELATALAWRAVGKEPTGVPQPAASPAPQLVVWADVEAADITPFALAWEVAISNIDRNGDGPVGRYYIDARDGVVLQYRNDKHECGFVACRNADHGSARNAAIGPQPADLPPVPTTITLQAWTRTGNDAYSALTNVPLAGVEVSVPGVGSGTFVTDQNGQFTIDINAPVSITLGALDGIHHRPMVGVNPPAATLTVQPGVNDTIQLLTASASTNEAAHTTTSWWMHRTNEWVRSILGSSSQLTTISNMLPTVNIASTCNAYYTNNTINFYQQGGNCANTAFSTVIAHEWGHGLDDRYGGISNSTGDGLSEGWGDILGMYLVDSPLLGSGFQSPGVALRRGDNTLQYPQTGAGVHTAGQTWMGFAWQLRQQLRTAFGTTYARQVSDEIVVGSIVANATNQPNAVTQVFLADDDDGNLLNGTPHYDQLRAAALAKNLPFPEKQLIQLAHAPLGNTTRRLEPRLVNATAALIEPGSIAAVQLRYRLNGGAVQTREMVSNGSANGYRAVLPGNQNGSTEYWIEAQHLGSNGSTTVRMPLTGVYSYNTTFPASGPFVGFYLESFENGANGWTNGRYSGNGTNDWQVGVPAGRSSTVSGVAWVDPGPGNSTGAVYGTDLGNGTWNGRYSNSTSYFARSPVMDCSGRSGVHLRFKRWLSCEMGIYDQAEIYVNGTRIWQNAANSHHLDTAWQLVEYSIPMADNNPAVQVEFRITTDSSLNLGGWQFDDVELGTRFIAPLDAELRMQPEQCAQGSPMSLSVQTQGGAKPFVLAIGDSFGPTLIPGIPVMFVGGSYFTLPEWTDASGNFQLAIGAPPVAAAQGLLWFSQVLTLDASFSNFVTSNQALNLFVQ